MPLLSAPLAALAAFGFIALGYPVYLLTQTKQPQSYGIMAFGEKPKAAPLTRTERTVEAIRSLLNKVLSLFGKGSEPRSQAGQYQVVELEDEPGNGGELSRTQTRQ